MVPVYLFNKFDKRSKLGQRLEVWADGQPLEVLPQKVVTVNTEKSELFLEVKSKTFIKNETINVHPMSKGIIVFVGPNRAKSSKIGFISIFLLLFLAIRRFTRNSELFYLDWLFLFLFLVGSVLAIYKMVKNRDSFQVLVQDVALYSAKVGDVPVFDVA